VRTYGFLDAQQKKTQRKSYSKYNRTLLVTTLQLQIILNGGMKV